MQLDTGHNDTKKILDLEMPPKPEECLLYTENVAASGRWTTVLEDKIPEEFQLSRGWANSLSLEVEALGFSEATEKAHVRRLAFNLSKWWPKLGVMDFKTLAKMNGKDFLKVAMEPQ